MVQRKMSARDSAFSWMRLCRLVPLQDIEAQNCPILCPGQRYSRGVDQDRGVKKAIVQSLRWLTSYLEDRWDINSVTDD
jgi:hypothetical protein